MGTAAGYFSLGHGVAKTVTITEQAMGWLPLIYRFGIGSRRIL